MFFMQLCEDWRGLCGSNEDAVRVANHYNVELHYPENPEVHYSTLGWLRWEKATTESLQSP